MKKKNLKIIGIIAIIIFITLGIFLGIKLIGSKEKTLTPVMYEVTKEGSSNKMFLFGSIHLANKDDLIFPDYVLDAYNNSHYLACEYNIVAANADFASAQEIAMKMLYQDGTTIKDHINNELYTKITDFLTKKNMYNGLYDYYKPVFFYSLMSNIIGLDAKLNSEAGIDEYFINKAIEDKKTILEVESMQYQMNLLLSFSDRLYEIAINDVLENYDDTVKETAELYSSWKTGDDKKMLELNDEDIDILDSYTEEEKKEISNFNKKIVDDRNITMTDKAIEYFNNNQDVFFMVGALHIIGENGIANRLQEKGYTVTRIN